MARKWITIRASDGSKFRAYMASPAGGKGPGLLLMQEIFGVNAHMREVAEHFAEEDYVVVVPDLFWRLAPHIELGFGEADRKKAFDYFSRFDIDKAIRDVAATLKAVRGMPRATAGVGVIGSTASAGCSAISLPRDAKWIARSVIMVSALRSGSMRPRRSAAPFYSTLAR
jgi:carboxymethylenebutenolidase